MSDPNKPDHEQGNQPDENEIPGKGSSDFNASPPPIPPQSGGNQESGNQGEEQSSDPGYYTYEKPGEQSGYGSQQQSDSTYQSSGQASEQYPQASQQYQNTQPYQQSSSYQQNQDPYGQQQGQQGYDQYGQQQNYPGYQQQGGYGGYPQQGGQYHQEGPNPAFGIIGLIVSLVSIFFILCCAPIGVGLSTIGIVLGYFGKREAAKYGEKDIPAEIALYLGIVSFLLSFAYFIFTIVMAIVNPTWAEDMFQKTFNQ